MSCYLGFDTSNYTTSVAAVFSNSVVNKRKILPVPENQRGLRQSNAVFLHLKQLPLLYEQLCEEIPQKNISSVGVSTRPRSIEGSYMPVFLVGQGFADVVARTLGIPINHYSHQDGHIMAGIESSCSREFLNDSFISVHLSGGTTEILRTTYTKTGFSCEIVGGTLDISAGQVIDRIGVMCGMPFPAGAKMEEIITESTKSVRLPISVSGGFFNLSGLESKASQIKDLSSEVLSKSIFLTIGETLSISLNNVIEKYNIKNILVVGGVASNSIVRNTLLSTVKGEVRFASRELSSDNACGIAYLEKFRNGDY